VTLTMKASSDGKGLWLHHRPNETYKFPGDSRNGNGPYLTFHRQGPVPFMQTLQTFYSAIGCRGINLTQIVFHLHRDMWGSHIMLDGFYQLGRHRQFPALVMPPSTRLSPEEFSDGISPRKAIKALGVANLRKSVISDMRIIAARVPMPLKARSFFTLGA